MTERAQVWVAVRPHLAPYGHFTRIESPTETGIPDVAYTVRGVSGWFENKLFDRGLARCPTHLTLAQVMWGEDEARAGGLWHLLGKHKDVWILHDIAGARALLEGETPLPILTQAGRFPLMEMLAAIAPPDRRRVPG